MRELLAAVLRRGGHDVATAASGEEGLRVFGARTPDLVLLDLNMPGMDGWETLERLRTVSDRPVMMLTADDDELSRVRGLMRGADDYLVKPASAPELLARVVALLRRSRRNSGGDPAPVYDDGLVRVDLLRRSTSIDGRELALTPLEFRLLAALVREPGVTVTKERLTTAVWGDQAGGDHLKLYVGYLRRKLATRTDVELIETVRGVGYRWQRGGPELR